MTGRRRMNLPRAAVAIALLLAVAGSGCDDDCCTVVDSFPIPLSRAPLGGPLGGDGALYVTAARPDAPAASFPMLIATGSPITVLAGDASGRLVTQKANFDLLDSGGARRALFRNLSILRLPLGA